MSQTAISALDVVPAGSYLEIEFTMGGLELVDTATVQTALTNAGFRVVNCTVNNQLFGGPVIDVFFDVETSDAAGNIGSAAASVISSAYSLVWSVAASKYWLVSSQDASNAGAASGVNLESTVYMVALAVVVVVAGYFLLQLEKA